MSSLSLPLPAEVLVVHVPRLAILELQCLADLLLRRLHGVVVGAELKLTRKLRVLQGKPINSKKKLKANFIQVYL